MANGIARVDSGQLSSMFEQSVQSGGLDDKFLLDNEKLTLRHVSSMQRESLWDATWGFDLELHS